MPCAAAGRLGFAEATAPSTGPIDGSPAGHYTARIMKRTGVYTTSLRTWHTIVLYMRAG